MTPTRKLTQAFLSLTMILSLLLSLARTQPAAAQEGDGIKREVNAETGKVSFIGPEEGKRSVSARALGIAPSARASSPAAAALALVKRFGTEFGVANPERDLTELRTRKQDNGRVSVHYQQNYQGIPVIGGELIVNTNGNGDLYSMNGEAAQDLAVDTQPTILAEKAIEVAKQGMVKWYGGASTDYQPTEPSLWIFDEKLLRPSIRPVELVWRMDMTPTQPGQPIRELVLVNAKTGNISLHFNQVDTAWGGTQSQDPNPTETPTPLPTEEVVPTETEAPAEVMPMGTPVPTETALPAVSTKSPESGRTDTHPAAYTGTTRYVATIGTDSGACTNSSSPCANIQYAINQSANGDVIKVTDGTYYYPGSSLNSTPNVVILNKGVLLSGGWQSGFSSQTGVSIIDGQNTGTGQKTYNGILVTAASAAEVVQFIIQNSTSSDSGAIYHLGTSLTLRNSTLRNNTAGNRGGGIFVTNNAALNVINSTISGNTAYQGAGIYVNSGTTNIEYSTIAYNTAANSGGGIYRGGGTLNVHNSILANNTNTTAPNCNILNASGNNIIGSITGCTIPAGTEDQLDVDPQIDASLTGTAAVHALLAGSPAINAGNPASCTTNAQSQDQRGIARPQNTGCDIGAFEFNNFQAGVPYSITIFSGDAQKKQINHAFDNPLTVTVRDYLGTSVSGASVTFTAPAGGASGTFASNSTRTETVITNASGVGTSSVFTANNTSGVYTVIASINESTSTTSFSLENLPSPGTPASFNITGGNNQQKTINQAYDTPFSVTVLDPYGDSVPSGVNVTFTAPVSGASGTFASNSTRTETVATNASGVATSSIFTANGTVGSFTVTVSVQGIATTANLSLQNLYIHGAPNTITYVSGSNQQRQLHQAFPNPFVALVSDGYGDPVSGVDVTFTAPASGASGTFASNSTRTETVTTDAAGHATSSIFTANEAVGSYTVTASTSGVASQANYQLQNQYIPGVPQNITVTSGNNQGTLPNSTFANPFVVLVKDGYGTVVSGVEVTFTASESGASGTFASTGTRTETVITNATGYATSSILTANSISGNYTISASTSGVTPAASITATNIGMRYVKTLASGGVDSGDCSSTANACATINYAISQAFAGEGIKIAIGAYTGTGTEVVLVNKNTTLSAGWNEDFTVQNGYSTIDGELTRRGVTVNSGITVVIERIVIRNGKSASGGGIYNSGTLTLNNSTLNGNVATDRGGALLQYSGSLTLNNSTVSGNAATYSGGGVYIWYGTFLIKNTIIYGNSANNTPNCGSGGPVITSAGYNITGSGCGSGTGDLINVDPLLGGFIGYYPLQASSPAIDAGNPATPGSGGNACLATDQRGISRLIGARCDIGAYEYTIPGSIASLSIVSGDGQRVSPGFSLVNPLKVVALDSYGSPVPGVAVTFTAPESGPSGVFAGNGTQAIVTTDENGIATSPSYTANIILGSYTVVASVSGLAPISFSLRNFGWFVSPTGNDANDCQTPSTPCATIQAAIDKAAAGEVIKIAGGTYTGSGSRVVNITKNLTISGGWNSTFTAQNETTIVDGENARIGITIGTGVVTTLEYLTIQNGRGSIGAGIYSSGTLTLNHSVVRNYVTTGSVGEGLHLTGTTVINNSTITENSTPSGQSRGIYISDSTLTINNSYIGNNGNGGIYLYRAALNLNNTTIANNSGNGILSSYSSINAQNSTIAYNSGTGLYIIYSTNITVRNSIITHNAAKDCSGTISTSDHNIIGNSTGCYLTTSTGDLLNVDAKTFDTPFGTPAYLPLKFDSPAINAGNPATCLATDQRGVSRPQGSACDIGAFERRSTTNPPHLLGILSGDYQKAVPGHPLPLPFRVFVLDDNGDAVSGLTVTFTAPATGASGIFTNRTNTTTAVTNSDGIATSSAFTTNTTVGGYSISATADGVTPLSFHVTNLIWLVSPTGGGVCTLLDPHCTTIQAAINSASSDETILVEKGVYLNDSANITKDLVLKGGWNSSFTAQDGQTIIDGGKLRRNVHIGADVTVTMDHFDIRNGKVANDLGGGGILNNGALTFANGAIYNNSAHHILYTDAVSRGGGIYSNGTQLTLTNVTVSNNEADTGGGIFVTTGANGTHGITTLNNVSITQNFATNLGATASGGGIENQNGSPLTLTNTILASNAAEEGQDCYGTLTSGGYNLIGLNLDCGITPAEGDQIGTQFEPLDAMLGDLKDNGGDTATHALLTGSPAIDAGNPATCAAMDQRRVARPQSGTCDIGAFEGSETQTTTANIKTYTAAHTAKWPGSFLCDMTTPDCTGGSDPSADYAHQYAIGTYNFYLTTHGRKGIDNNNMPIISTVHYCGTSGCPYGNATWSGAQVVYGDGFPDADDNVAHEITHGITQYESNLMYFYQSGAINESFSDLWGEYYDQINGLGTDTELVKWEIGEDNSVWGAIRSMSDPTAYGDPDKMTSTLYAKTDNDSGGVHSNSGINNKAVFLMVDGGTFNAKTVAALGWDKTIAIYYEVQTNVLTSAADYSDLYYALQQACSNLTGQNGITRSDCLQVKNALDAVQMNSPLAASFNADTSPCPTGMITVPAQTVFSDSFENSTDNWNIDGSWKLERFYASSGSHMMFGDDTSTQGNSFLTMRNNVTLPAGSGLFLFFKHAFAFEYDSDGYYDGAVLEYSKNNGAWTDARVLFSGGQNYTGAIFKGYGNALQGRLGFVGDSHGYGSSRYSLSSLAGQNVRFRWRFATDEGYSYWGWFVDDISIYRCTSVNAIPALQVPPSNAVTTDYTPYLDWTDVTPLLRHYQVQIATDDEFMSLVYDENNRLVSEFTIPANLQPNKTYYWRVQAFSTIDQALGWSAARTFRTAMLPPTPIDPVNGDNSYNKRPILQWDASSGASGYKIQIAKVNNFSTVVVTGTTTTTSFIPLLDLLPNTTYYWHVQATGLRGPSLWSETRSFTTGNPPAVPILTAPLSNALLLSYQPKLDWNNVTDPLLHHYQLQLATNATFTNLVVPDQETGTVSEFIPSTPLDPNQTYYWRVRSYSASGDYSIWSPARSFRTVMLPPALTSPTNGESLHNKRPILTWETTSGASGYKIQIAKVNNFSTVVVTGTTTTTSFIPLLDLLPNTTYYWHVQATGLRGPSLWSETRSFTTGNPPAIPILTAPLSNALLLSYQPKLDWNNVTDPLLHHYQLQLATDAAFTNLVVPEQDTGTVSEFTPSTPLDPNQTYYWRVRSYSASGDYSAWSLVRAFRTAIFPPTLITPADGSTIGRLKPIFVWADVSGATGYTIQVSTSATFSTFLLNSNTATSVYFSPTSLPIKKTLYWRVRANSQNGPSAWTTFSFRIEQ